MADANLQTGEYLSAVDSMLRALVVSPGPAYDAYYGMFRYHLGWTDINFVETKTDSGKRIRPLLCLLSCEAVGGDWRPALPVAVAIELVHNFSLIHDDIEDQSDERRGRTAVWKAWGLAQGLNAGDGMFMLARLALDRLSNHGASSDKCTRINLEFDATTLALCHGQFLDLGFEARLDVTVDEYIQMIRGKTAALISSATRIGAMIATDDARTIDALSRFGENIGLAFQITDDILGIWGDPSVTGKSVATDILSRKKSLPAILGLSDRVFGQSLQAIYRLPRLEPAHVAHVLELLDAANVRQNAQQRADQYRAAGLKALDESGLDNHAVSILRDIADTMTRRQK
jgi:geranylgeranyl diphosphate synthase type I